MKKPPPAHEPLATPLFGERAADWICPLCSYTPRTPLIACPECGCHILLTIKIRRLRDTLAQEGEEEAAKAIFHKPT